MSWILLPVNLKVVNEDDGWSVKMSTNQLAITLVLEQETTLDTIIICVFQNFLHFLFSTLFLYQLFKLFIGIFIPVLWGDALSGIIGVTMVFCRSDLTKDQMIVDLAFRSKILLWGGVAFGSLSIGILGYAVMRYDSFSML